MRGFPILPSCHRLAPDDVERLRVEKEAIAMSRPNPGNGGVEKLEQDQSLVALQYKEELKKRDRAEKWPLSVQAVSL